MSWANILMLVCLIFIFFLFIDSYFIGYYIPQEVSVPLNLERFVNQPIIIQGQIIKEPMMDIDKIDVVVFHKTLGRILVSADLNSYYQYGNLLEIRGKLLLPKIYKDFNYRQYLAKDEIFFVMYKPKIKLIALQQGNKILALIYDFKNRLRKSMDLTLLPPHSSILKATILGDRQVISQKLKDDLNRTGTTHVLAISGMNMVILSQILLYSALGLGLWRQQIFYFIVIILGFYVLMIGLPASAVRAYIFTFLLLLAQKTGRLNTADRALVFSAVLMLILNPMLLKADVGFQLSFMAVLGLIYLKPLYDRWLNLWPNPWHLKDVLTLTLAAQTAVLPLLIYHFGRLSLISPLANLLIVPFLPFLMIAGLILSFTGLIWLSLAKIMAWPVWIILDLMIRVINYLSQLSWAAFNIKNFSWLYMICYYLILLILIKKNKKALSNY